jgi:hypothetical protein
VASATERPEAVRRLDHATCPQARPEPLWTRQYGDRTSTLPRTTHRCSPRTDPRPTRHLAKPQPSGPNRADAGLRRPASFVCRSSRPPVTGRRTRSAPGRTQCRPGSRIAVPTWPAIVTPSGCSTAGPPDQQGTTTTSVRCRRASGRRRADRRPARYPVGCQRRLRRGPGPSRPPEQTTNGSPAVRWARLEDSRVHTCVCADEGES